MLSRVLIDRRNHHRRSVIRRYQGLVREMSLPGSVVRDMQDRRLADLLNDAAGHVPFWRSRLPSAGTIMPGDARTLLAGLPVMERSAIQSAPADFLCDQTADAMDDATGGSTGTPLNFKVDRATQIAREASLYWANHLAGWRYGQRIAMLWGSDRDVGNAKKDPRLELRWKIDNIRWYNAFDMGEDRMRAFHDAMTLFRPHLIVAYSGSLWIYARFLEDNGLRPSYPLTSLVSSAEVLTPEMRAVIERVFGRPVFNRYGNRETGAIGAEDARHDGFVVNNGDFIVEIDSPDPVHEPGPILLTYFPNRAMPFIRYNTGDLGVWAPDDPVRPGICRIARITGREGDTIRTRGGKLVHGEYFTHLLYGQKAVRQFQFIQETLDHYRLLVVAAEPVSADVADGWRRKIADHIDPAARLDIEWVDAIPVLKSGKHKFTLSKVPPR